MYNNVNVNHPLIQRENNYVSIKKNVSIHSDDRDISKWPNANEFEIELPQPLKQVQYMKLTDMTLPNDLCNISSTYQNNKLLLGYEDNTAINNTYVKNDLKISFTDGCGTGATITSVVISIGVVTDIDVDGGTGYKAGDKIVVTINGIELGIYIIQSGDITNISTGDFISGTLTGLMPSNPNTISTGTYNVTDKLKPYIITIPNGLYTSEELASTLETLINIAVVGNNYQIDAGEVQKVFVKYNAPQKKFYFGNNETKNFSLFFDEKTHEIYREVALPHASGYTFTLSDFRKGLRGHNRSSKGSDCFVAKDLKWFPDVFVEGLAKAMQDSICNLAMPLQLQLSLNACLGKKEGMRTITLTSLLYSVWPLHCGSSRQQAEDSKPLLPHCRHSV